MRFQQMIIVLGLSFSVSACSTFHEFFGTDLNINGAHDVVDGKSQANQIDLIAVIDPQPDLSDGRCFVRTNNPGGYKTNPALDENGARSCLQNAYANFYRLAPNQEKRRNEIMGELRAASELNCAEFTQHLNTFQSSGNFWLGSFATTLAGAGAIVSSAATANALSGAGSIMSGVRAEFDADIFFKEAAPVIVNAIGERRAKLRDEMDNNMGKKIEEYPLSVAIADVFRYNDACSLVQGLYAANQSITLAEHPGVDAMLKAQLQANLSRMIDKNPSMVDSSVLRNDGTGDSTKLAAVGAAIVPTTYSSGEPSAAYQSGLDALMKETASFKAALNAAQPDTGRGLDVRKLVFSPASPDVPLDKSLDGILSAASTELSEACQGE